MKALTKSEILKTTHCRFFLWHTTIDCCEVSKKALSGALRAGRHYSAEITETCKIEHGIHAGKSFFTCVIML